MDTSVNFFGRVKSISSGSMSWDGYVVIAGLICLLFLGALAPAQAQDIDLTELKRQFFEPLSDEQKVSLLRTMDRSAQRTSLELGAKYRWGYIPSDRKPPISLAKWWDGLNQRQRREERLKWFRNHYQQLNVERSARELGLRDRLTKLYRELGDQEDNTGLQFESVSFPKGNLDLDTAQQTKLPESYRRFKYGDEEIDVTSDQSSPPERDREVEPRETTPDEPAVPSDQQKTEDASMDESPPAQTAKQPDTSPEGRAADKPDTETFGDTPPSWERRLEFEGGTVIFQRVGDEVDVMRKGPSDTHLRTQPDYEYPVRETPEDEETIRPPLRFENGAQAPRLRFYEEPDPQPGLR
jgi:hypothetical protein